MYNKDPRNPYPYTDEEYVRTITHEMGHVFGIDDGYIDSNKQYQDLIGVTRRPDAQNLGLIEGDDIMRSQFSRWNISSADIAMFILAYANDEFQSYADYTHHKQLKYFGQGKTVI